MAGKALFAPRVVCSRKLRVVTPALHEPKLIMSAWRAGLHRGEIATHLFSCDAWPELGILVQPPARNPARAVLINVLAEPALSLAAME
jgi:hypothetical protein